MWQALGNIAAIEHAPPCSASQTRRSRTCFAVEDMRVSVGPKVWCLKSSSDLLCALKVETDVVVELLCLALL